MFVVISALKVLCLFAEKMYTKENENSSESFGPLIYFLSKILYIFSLQVGMLPGAE